MNKGLLITVVILLIIVAVGLVLWTFVPQQLENVINNVIINPVNDFFAAIAGGARPLNPIDLTP